MGGGHGLKHFALECSRLGLLCFMAYKTPKIVCERDSTEITIERWNNCIS